MTSNYKWIVVVPVFEDVEAASLLFVDLEKTLGQDVFVVAVDDGSIAQPIETTALSDAQLNGIVIQLKRNIGHQRAIAVGLSYVADHFDCGTCIVMDSDGEDIPETIHTLTAPLASDDIDVVVAHRKSRVESLQFKAFYVIYKKFFQLMTGRNISFGNFMALKPMALKRLANMQELWVHVAATVLVSKLRISLVPIARGPRYAGQSKMNFSSLVLHGFRAFVIYAEDVIVRLGVLCALVSAVSLSGIVLSIFLKAVGLATPGWFSTALGLMILILLQTGALALMSLMMTGIARGSGVLSTDYRKLIECVNHTGDKVPSRKTLNA